MKMKKWIKKRKNILKEKTIVITGTTSGIGFETLKILTESNATIIVGVRNISLANEQKQTLLKTNPSAKIEVLKLDLTNTQNIKSFAETVQQKFPNGIDALINNAGIFARPKNVLANGIEEHFFVNTIAPIFLSNLLLSSLEKRNNSKIIFLSSISIKKSKINFNDIDLKTETKNIKTYANSKLWLTLYAQTLKHNLETNNSKTSISIVQPGITASSLLSNKNGTLSKGLYKFVNFGMKLIFHSTKKASLSTIESICNKTQQNTWIGPCIFGIWGLPKHTKLKLKSNNQETIQYVQKTLNFLINNM